MKTRSFKLIVKILCLTLGASLLHATPIRIMPLGDSITYGERVSDVYYPRPTGQREAYRSHLWYKLSAAGYEADFVGSQTAGQSVSPPLDPQNEGHSGWTSFNIANKTYQYLAQNQPDIVLLHIGTNDHGTFVGGVNSILDEIDLYEEESGHSIRVIVALIIDRKSPDRTIKLFNDNLKFLVEHRINSGDNLTLVDMYRGAGLAGGDYADNTHPRYSGYEKMARVWFNALMAPYNVGLRSFPSSLVRDRSYIERVTVDEESNTIEFVTKIPDNGITF